MGFKSVTMFMRAILVATMATCILGQAQAQLLDYQSKPWPTYSLHNMPQTRFTCHDKILGGYYADPETQCQMFHVCVKVAGVGVQDFRFLCPNTTAFDQEAQTCADWGDVDCESSVLYYGSDNFDLYRIGSGYESKRAPLAEEEESTFHLQRAESGDIRRSKETRIDQKVRPDQPPNYSKHFAAATPQRNSIHNYATSNQQNGNNNNNNNNYNDYQNEAAAARKIETTPARRPIVNYYTPTTTTTTTSTERYFDESKQEYDDIFKGSHSSHFFANRNGGREDDFIDHPVKTTKKFNDFNHYNKKATETTTVGKVRTQATARTKRIKQTSTPKPTTAATTSTTWTTTPTPPKTTNKFAITHAAAESFYDFPAQKSTSHAPIIAISASTASPSASPTAPSSVRSSYGSAANRFSFSSHDYQTQEHIAATTYNPANSVYRVKSTTPKYNEFNRDNSINERGRSTSANAYLPQETSKIQNKPTVSAQRKAQKFERTKQKFASRNATTATYTNEFDELPKIKLQQPQPFQSVKPEQPVKPVKPVQPVKPVKPVQPVQPVQLVQRPTNTNGGKYLEPQFYRTRDSAALAGKSLRQSNQEPAAFNEPQKQRGAGQPAAVRTSNSAINTADTCPRGFANRGSINFKATTQRDTDYYEPPTTSTIKKFSTLVPKTQQSLTPTTFKPTTYQKPLDNYFYQTQQTVRPAASKTPTTTKQPIAAINALTPTTANPYYNPDEDDGQYHPELYEVDFPRNRFNLQRSSPSSSSSASTTTTKPITKKTTTSKTTITIPAQAPARSVYTHNNDYQNPQRHLQTQQQSAFRKQQDGPSESAGGDLSDEEELFKTAHSLNFGAASINKLRADIFKAEKTSQQYNSQYIPSVEQSDNKRTPSTTSKATSVAYTTNAPYTPSSTASSTAFNFFAPYSTTNSPPTSRLYTSSSSNSQTSTSAAQFSTITTRRPTTLVATTTPYYSLLSSTVKASASKAASITKSSGGGGGKSSSAKKGKKGKGASKRPAHADEDTSYDYAYYDTDTLSESPQEYPEYEIAEFVKTRRN